MQKRLAILIFVVSCVAGECRAQHQSNRQHSDRIDPVQIGVQRELFIDRHLVDVLDNAQLKLHHPIPGTGTLPFDKPWEGAFAGYATLIKDSDIFRMYYRGLPIAGADATDTEVTCYAVSLDGTTWHKPNLGIFEYQGSKQNNIVLMGHTPASHNFAPFLDSNPDAKLDQRYKALGGGAKGLIAFASPDGIHWHRLQQDPVFTQGIFDSQNVSFWSAAENQYVCYFRTWTGDGYSGKRTVSKTTSKDFMDWTDPQPMTFGDTPIEHLYTNQTSPYFRAPHISVALAARFMPGRKVISNQQATNVRVNQRYFHDCSDSVLLTTRGGYVYDRTFMESFIRPGTGPENWVSRSNYAANGIAAIDDNMMCLYMSRNYGQPTSHLQQYLLRTDGFASIHAGYDGGFMKTKLLSFPFANQQELVVRKKAWERRIAAMSESISPQKTTDSIHGQFALNVQRPVDIELPETQSLGETFTLAAHLKDIPNGHRRLFSAYDGGSTTPGELILDFNSGGNISDDGAIRFFWDDFKITVDNKDIGIWSKESGDTSPHHIALTWNRGTAKLFFDGKLVANATSEKHSQVDLELGNLRFGEDIPPTSLTNEPFTGKVDDVLVLKHALSDEEIERMAHEGAGVILDDPSQAVDSGIWLSMEDSSMDWSYRDVVTARQLHNALGKPVSLTPLPAVSMNARELEINMATSAAGSVRVGVLHENGDPVPGFALEDCDIIIGDQISRIVTWRGGHSDISSLCEKPIRFVFELKDADVYSMQVQ